MKIIFKNIFGGRFTGMFLKKVLGFSFISQEKKIDMKNILKNNFFFGLIVYKGVEEKN